MTTLRCGCTDHADIPADCNCELQSSDTVSVGADSGGADWTIGIAYDLDPDNLLTSSFPAGMLGALPARVLSPPRARVKRNANVTLSGDTYISFDEVVYDNEDDPYPPFWDIGTPTRLTNTLGVAACFCVGALFGLELGGSPGAEWGVGIRRDGSQKVAVRTRAVTDIVSPVPTRPLVDGLSVETEVELGVGGYVEFFMQSDDPTGLFARQPLYAPFAWMSWTSD